ncbi:MAG: VWA domain-containing protein [Actinomycetota bacterium]
MAGADAGLLTVLVGFGRALRDEGVIVGSGSVIEYCDSMSVLDPTELLDLYHAGRASMICRQTDLAIYDRVFKSYFLANNGPLQNLLKMKVHLDPEAETEFEVLNNPEAGQEKQFDAPTGLMGSNMEVLKHKRFAEMTDEEKAALRKMMQKFKFLPPKRRTRRTVVDDKGSRPDLRRTIRSAMRRNGELVDLHRRERRVRRRKVILILDISGSMADYSRALMHFGYAAARAAVGTTASAKLVEVFVFGTRLTRITTEMQKKDPDIAFNAASKAVFDWEGGTRIGASLDDFVRNWGRRGMCRGAIVVICSDGLDRGDPGMLAEAMERLSRLCHKLIWMNPLKGDEEEFQARSVGMLVAKPFVDELLSGHDLASLEKLALVLPKLG